MSLIRLLDQRSGRSFAVFVWAGLAAVTGIVVATQPAGILLIALTLAALLLLSTQTPLAAIAALVVLAPLRTLIATEAPLQLPLDIGQITLVAVLAVWLARSVVISQALPRLVWSPIYLPLLIFVVIGGLTAFSAWSLSAWLNEWLKWVQILLIAAVVLSLGRGRHWELLVTSLVAAGAANALVGIYQFLGGSGAIHLLINDRFFRAFGTFGQPNPFGGFMGLLAPLSLLTALGYAVRLYQTKRFSGDLLRLVFYAGASGIIIVGIFVSWSRGSWLAFVASLIVVTLALPRKVWQGMALMLSLILVITLLWIADLIPASIAARISSSTEEFFAFEDVRGVDITPENYAVVERLSHWQAALNMARAHPWLGVGLGNYEVAYPTYRLLNWVEPLGHAHNNYLNILAEGGVIGLLGYGKVWLVIILMTWRTRRHPDLLARFTAIGLSGTWTYLSVHSIFDNLLVNNLFIHIGVMCGILGILYSQANQTVKLRGL